MKRKLLGAVYLCAQVVEVLGLTVALGGMMVAELAEGTGRAARARADDRWREIPPPTPHH